MASQPPDDKDSPESIIIWVIIMAFVWLNVIIFFI